MVSLPVRVGVMLGVGVGPGKRIAAPNFITGLQPGCPSGASRLHPAQLIGSGLLSAHNCLRGVFSLNSRAVRVSPSTGTYVAIAAGAPPCAALVGSSSARFVAVKSNPAGVGVAVGSGTH